MALPSCLAAAPLSAVLSELARSLPGGSWGGGCASRSPETGGSVSSLQIAGFWREVGVASKQHLALMTPKRLEALFLTLSEAELTVKAAYRRYSWLPRAGAGAGVWPGAWPQRWPWGLDHVVTQVDQPSLRLPPKTFTPAPRPDPRLLEL